jgi:hypothetical protein
MWHYFSDSVEKRLNNERFRVKTSITLPFSLVLWLASSIGAARRLEWQKFNAEAMAPYQKEQYDVDAFDY